MNISSGNDRLAGVEHSGPAIMSAIGAELLEIWLVDDQSGLNHLVSRNLNMEAGVNCSGCYSSLGEVVSALSRKSPPHAILLGLEMSSMMAAETIPLLKQLAPHTSIYLFTVFFHPRYKQRALAAGATGYLLKRHSCAEIVAAIRAGRQLSSH